MGNEGDPVCLIDKFVIIVIKGNVEYGKNKVKITKVNPKSAFAEVVS